MSAARVFLWGAHIPRHLLGEKRGSGAVPGPVPPPVGPASPQPHLLCQGDRGAPGELGETGEKVRWGWGLPAPGIFGVPMALGWLPGVWGWDLGSAWLPASSVGPGAACGVGGRLPEMLLCFAPQGDRGAPGPEGEKVGAGGWGLPALPGRCTPRYLPLPLFPLLQGEVGAPGRPGPSGREVSRGGGDAALRTVGWPCPGAATPLSSPLLTRELRDQQDCGARR